MKTPYIGEQNGVKTLFVNDEPFLVLGGELHNSSASNLDYMEEKVWPYLRGLNMNTVVLPVAWESIEAEEGKFEFGLVDGLIMQARREHMKLVILWFGLWKNAESNYVPDWVKRDYENYFCVEDARGSVLNTISPFCSAAVEKDAYAFEQLMAHIKAVDEQEHTVILMQIENEIGVHGAERDFSPRVEPLYRSAVPEDIKNLYSDDHKFRMNAQGVTWEEVFGQNAPELFMAWGYANAIETIASKGQQIYGLPMYVNAWLEQHPWRPGTYPCGGPIMKVSKMWKHCAPSLFTLAPDIYVPNTAEVLDEYTALDNPLFVPEIRKDPAAVSYMLYAFAKNNAIGVSPFGVEDINANPDDLKKPPLNVMMALNIDVSAFDCSRTAPYLSKLYSLISEMQPLYLQYRNTDHLKAFVKHNEVDDGIMLEFEKYDIVVSYNRKDVGKPVSSGMIYELSPDKFIFVGMNYSFKIYPKLGRKSVVMISQAVEGDFENGNFVAGRVLNGDERMDIRLEEMPGAIMVNAYEKQHSLT